MKNNKEQFQLHHGMPTTRREFLSSGLIGFSGMMLGSPLLYQALKISSAMAEGEDSKGFVPFLTFDLAGGAGLPGNFLVGKTGGPHDMLSSYDTLGWNPRANGALDERFGLPMAGQNVSKILQGMLETMSTEAQQNFRMGSLLHFSRDDTQENPLSALSLASKAGIAGEILRAGLGTERSDSGGNSISAFKSDLFKPLVVNTLQDIVDSATPGGAIQASMNGNLLKKYFATLSDLRAMQVPKYRSRPMSAQFETQTSSAYSEILETFAKPSNVDSRVDAEVQAVYGVNRNTSLGDRNAVISGIVMNTLKHQSGPGVITIGGCDYHTGNQNVGDQKDLEIGREIGRAVELAKRLKVPLFFHMLTDGGLGADKGTRNWRIDSGDRSMSVIGYYSPVATPKYRSDRSMQIGAYTDGQGVNLETLIGNKPILVAYAVLANYLNVLGRLGDFSSVAGAVFSPEQLDSLLIFEGAVV